MECGAVAWSCRGRLRLVVLTCLAVLWGNGLKAADAEAKPVGKFLTVKSPIDQAMFGRIKNAALSLQNEAETEDRPAVLILEIPPGTSRFGQVRDLAKFLTSSEISRVKTVAWVTGDVTGYNVILALACNEIIMQDDSMLGDIGRGKPLDEDERQSILLLVRQRHNRMVSPALALAMMDKDAQVIKVEITRPDATTETRVVTKDEWERLAEEDVELRSETIKESGFVGRFTASEASQLGILAVQVRQSRDQLADLYNLERSALREELAEDDTTRVSLIRVTGMIDPILESFLERQIERAVADGARTIIFEIDSLGGMLVQSQTLAFAIADLQQKEVRTVAYVPEKAISGAAIIAMGCDEIYMHPDAQIGDAGPIGMRPGEQFERVPEKQLSLLRTALTTLAEKKGRPPALLMAMADKDMVVYQVTNEKTGAVTYMNDDEIRSSADVWLKGNPVPESREDNLLTLDGRRAHELKLAMPPVSDLDELKERLGIPLEMELEAAEPIWLDSLVFLLNTSTALFLLVVVGVILIYLELHFMTGLMGILSALCFSIFFWSRFLGGTAGWLEVVLFLLGLACIALEIFVVPGFGVFGVSGGLLVLASVIMACQTFTVWNPSGDLRHMAQTMGTLSLSVVSIVVCAVALNRFLPSMPFFGSMILTPPGSPDDASEPQLDPQLTGSGPRTTLEQDRQLVGQTGVAFTALRPAGKARIGDRFLDVVSDGSFIQQGATIQVVEVLGNRVVVRHSS